MHASIWWLVEDPVDLLRRYDATADEVLEDFPVHPRVHRRAGEPAGI
jgi:hypothetical protein